MTHHLDICAAARLRRGGEGSYLVVFMLLTEAYTCRAASTECANIYPQYKKNTILIHSGQAHYSKGQKKKNLSRHIFLNCCRQQGLLDSFCTPKSKRKHLVGAKLAAVIGPASRHRFNLLYSAFLHNVLRAFIALCEICRVL